ncbi:MAG: Crp/Fnr family transcriptional regulator [Gammaproteobacteria bacterium]|nr:Crp/Fnr family transcriptional regulator [Gammaproteobacteria bacterium]
MLNRMHLFSELNPSDSDILTQHSTTRTYPANSILINEGDDTDSLYVVLQGEVKVYASDENGKEVILNILGPGEYFGELALVDNEPRSASVKTIQPTKVMIIAKAEFKKVLADNPDMAFNMIQSLAKQVRDLTNNVKSLALMDVYGRVAHTLLDLASEMEDGKMVVNQKLTHQDIADMVGASREMVSRILKDLVNGGYISIKSKIVTINEKLPAGW